MLAADRSAARFVSLPVPPGTKLVQFKDFAQNGAGLYSADTGLLGPGPARVVYRLAPRSSTRSDATAGPTDPYYVMRFGGNDDTTVASGLDIAGFTIQATDQGHIYGGLFVGYSQGARVHDVVIRGIPGTSSAPPGETFSLAGWHANGMRVSNVIVDGRDGAGQPVAASLFATNSQDDVVFEHIVGHYSANGFGLTLWDSSNVTVRHADLRFNRRAINCEQPHPGLMQFIDCDLRGQLDQTDPHMTFSGTRGSTKVVITDPKVDRWPLRVGVAQPDYQGGAETQQVGDIHLIVAGKDVTDDPAYLIAGQVWGRTSTGAAGN